MLTGDSSMDGYTEQTPPRPPQMDEDIDSLDSRRPVSHVLETPELKGVSDPLVRLRDSSSDDAMSTDVTYGNTLSSHGNGKNSSSPRPPQHDGYGRRVSGGQTNPQRKRDEMRKSGSWRKKYGTLINTNTTATTSSPSSPDFASGAAPPAAAAAVGTQDEAPAASAGDPTTQASTLSTVTGCYISGPLMPPAGYPMPLLGQSSRSPDQQHSPQHEQPLRQQQLSPQLVQQPSRAQDQQQQQQQHQQPVYEDPRASVISSSSSGGSSKPSSVKEMPPPPWAQPPKTTSTTGTPGPRATSFDSGLDRSVLFNPEHIRGPAGEWVEVLRGEQGRIAVKSTPTQYEVLVWLPGFSINDITIVTRKNQVLHIVADQWDEQDHAQWEIRLGDDAVMTTVRAQFSGQELKITVARSGRLMSSGMSVHSNVSMRTASSRAPSMSGNTSHTMHERSFSTPTQPWGDTDRRDLEARMNRGAEAFC